MTTAQQEDRTKPVIAILTVSDERRPLRGNYPMFINLIKKGGAMGALVYVTTPAHLDLNRKKIVGLTYDFEKKEWVHRLFPLPQVVYNRIPFRKSELRPDVQETIQSCLRSRKIQLFNPSFFNKWALFEWLSRDKKTSAFIPKTEKLISAHNLESLFKHSPTLYLKPIRGKAGKGIMRLDRKKSGDRTEYRLIHYISDTDKRHVSHYSDIAELWENLREEIGDNDYIVQQGIPLTRFKKRPFDLRLLVQKNERGAWELTGIGARVAGRFSITTHVPRGGSINDPVKLLGMKFGALQAGKILHHAHRSALIIARQIEKASGQMWGEMSMDLGVDTKGHLWFFEANSKPMRFDEPLIRKKSLERIIQYCMYLARTNGRRNNKSVAARQSVAAKEGVSFV